MNKKDDSYNRLIEYYSSFHHPSHNGYEILSLPEPLLTWLLSIFQEKYSSPPVLSKQEWNHLFSVLRSHWIGPSIGYMLSRAPESSLPPPEITDHFIQEFRSSHVRSLQTEVQIKNLNQIARYAGADMLVIKGPALAHLVYPHPAMRIGSDIDLIIPSDHIPHVSVALQENGYSVRFDSFSISPHLYHHINFYPEASSRNELLVEVHWRPLFLPGSGGSATAEELISHGRSIRTSLVSFQTLDLADALIYAACHMCIFHAPMIRLSWIADIHYLVCAISKAGVWDLVLERCSHWQGRLALQEAIFQAEVWFGTTLPKPYNDWDIWPDPGEDELKIFSHIRKRRDGKEIYLHELLTDLPTFREKILAIWYFLTRIDTIKMDYPETTFWNYPSVWWKIIQKELKK